MPKPTVVIVGRPNVGKSTLFNRIARRRAAIVEDIPGVTRDRNYVDAEWEDKPFVVVDTGGFYPGKDDIFTQIKEQALFAVEEADVIIHLMDGREGLNPFDTELAGLIRASGKRAVWAVNKIDAPSRERLVDDFYRLGAEDLMPVSAAEGYGFGDLMDKVASLLPESAEAEAAVGYPKVAVVGRPNTGKSTLINALLGKQRLLVSPVPGTTRDSIDTVCGYYKTKYLLIDTAGIRRKDRLGYSLERFAMLRTLKSIERADVAAILLNAKEGIVSDDQKIAGLVHKEGKGAIFLFNKWDLVEDPEGAYKRLMADIERKLWFFSHAPVLTTSGLERKRITKLFPLIDGVMEERRKRLSTPVLNRFLGEIAMPSHKGRRVRLLYMTQVGTEPPAFSIFANLPEGVKDAQLRHIEALMRERFSFRGTPIRLYVKRKV